MGWKENCTFLKEIMSTLSCLTTYYVNIYIYIYILVKYRANKINQKQLELELNGYKVQHYNQRKEPP